MIKTIVYLTLPFLLSIQAIKAQNLKVGSSAYKAALSKVYSGNYKGYLFLEDDFGDRREGSLNIFINRKGQITGNSTITSKWLRIADNDIGRAHIVVDTETNTYSLYGRVVKLSSLRGKKIAAIKLVLSDGTRFLKLTGSGSNKRNTRIKGEAERSGGKLGSDYIGNIEFWKE